MTEEQGSSPTKESREEPIVLSDKEQAALEKITGGQWGKYSRVAMAALSALPWVGSLIGATATLSGENAQSDVNKVMFIWVQEHEVKLRGLAGTLKNIFERFESFGDRIKGRVGSEEYISLVRKTFAQWDHAETQEKKDMLRKLIANAGGITMAQDDLVRMFLEWIEKYHEFHFLVIREIYKHPDITRHGIWTNLRGQIPRDDSAEADLFKLLIHDLNTGHVIRQRRETNYMGQFVKSQPRRGGQRSDIYESAFENTKPYVLTELGGQFVHYVMEDLAPQIEGKTE